MLAGSGLSENVSRDMARVLSVAVQAANLGIWIWDLRTNEFEYSERAKEIFGLPPGEPVTREQIIAVLHPDDHQIAREQAARGLDPSLKRRDPYLYRIFRASDGALRWVQAFGEPIFETIDRKPEPVRYIGTVQDITEDILARQQLVEQEARLRLAIEASGIAVWELNLADQTVTHSPELNRLCGFPPDARPTLDELRSRYAPGERERIELEGAEARAKGETKYQSDIHYVWPDGTEKWLSLRAQLAPGETGYDGRIIGALVDITDQKKREEQQALLLSEFKHRIKNSFALTQSIVNQTLKGERISEATKSKLFARLQTMAGAHDLVAEGAWNGASLIAVLMQVSGAFDTETGGRVDVQGPDHQLSPKAALSFSLVLHELFTNAAKYGALSNDVGRIAVELEVEDGELPRLIFRWTEHGGPKVPDNWNEGFGTRLIDRVFAAQLGARVQRELQADGLRFMLSVPTAEIAP